MQLSFLVSPFHCLLLYTCMPIRRNVDAKVDVAESEMNDARGGQDEQSITDSTRLGRAARDSCTQELLCDAEHTYENVDQAGSASGEEPHYAVPSPYYADYALPHAPQAADD